MFKDVRSIDGPRRIIRKRKRLADIVNQYVRVPRYFHLIGRKKRQAMQNSPDLRSLCQPRVQGSVHMDPPGRSKASAPKVYPLQLALARCAISKPPSTF